MLAFLISFVALLQTTPPPESKVMPLEPFIGEWVIDAHWDNGTPLRARAVYSWMLDGRHMSAKTFVGPPESERQRYETVMTWHPGEACLVTYGFGVDGGVTEYRMDAESPTLWRIGFAPLHGKDARIRQTVEFIDADTFEWTVEMNQNDGWTRLIKAPWKRSAR